MPQLIGAALIAGGIGTAVIFGTLTYAAVAGYIIYSALTFVLLKALSGDGLAGMTSSGILTNGVDPTAPHRIIYGQQRVGGIVTYEEATDDNRFLHLMLCIAGHEVEEIGQIYINDEAVTLDGSGFVTSNDWNSKIRIRKHLGSDAQVADSVFLAETENVNVDSNFRGQGIAYLYIRMDYDAEVFAQGTPLITAVVKGRRIFNPANGLTEYTANFALCIRDYARAEFGVAATEDEFDDIIWGAQVDVCDELVNLDAGGTEKRYEMNGSFTLDLPPKDILPRMLTGGAATFFWSQGEFILKVGYFTTPVASFDESHMRAGINIDPRVPRRDNFNTVRGTFMDANQKWITVDYPQITGAAFVTEDNGEERSIDLALPFTTSGSMAQRLAKVTLFRNREQITFTGRFSLEAYVVQVGDNINITNTQMGFSSKPFEVQAWQLIYKRGDPIGVNMTLREISAAVFSWSSEESDIIGNETTLPPRSFFFQKARYDIDVATFPVDAAAAKTKFQEDVGTPLDGDTAIFSTKTGVNTVVQEVWQYDFATDTWSRKLQDVYGGNVVDGSVDTPILTASAVNDFSEVVIDTSSFVHDGSWTTSNDIDEITLQVNADDDLAAEKILFIGTLATYGQTVFPPTNDALTSIDVTWNLNAYIRTGSDTIIRGRLLAINQQFWLNQSTYAALINQLPEIPLYLVKGVDYDAGDLLVFKFGIRKARTGSTTVDYTPDVDKISGIIHELKR